MVAVLLGPTYNSFLLSLPGIYYSASAYVDVNRVKVSVVVIECVEIGVTDGWDYWSDFNKDVMMVVISS